MLKIILILSITICLNFFFNKIYASESFKLSKSFDGLRLGGKSLIVIINPAIFQFIVHEVKTSSFDCSISIFEESNK